MPIYTLDMINTQIRIGSRYIFIGPIITPGSAIYIHSHHSFFALNSNGNCTKFTSLKND